MASSFPHLSPDHEGKVVACLVPMRTEAHREDPGSALHFKADEQTLGMLPPKFQSEGTPGSGSILRCSPEQ